MGNKNTTAGHCVLTKWANIKEWIIYCIAKGLEEQVFISLQWDQTGKAFLKGTLSMS